jgi:hypothetical protein
MEVDGDDRAWAKTGVLILLVFQSTCSGLADTGRGMDKLGGLSAAGLPVSFSRRLTPSCLQQLHD